MKKTLLLAAALACSGVAQAEIYLCIPSHYGSVSSGSASAKEYDKYDDPDRYAILVDTEKGTKDPEDLAAEFKGGCETVSFKGRSILTCERSIDRFTSSLLTINLDDYKFMYTARLLEYISSSAGTCTKT